MMKRIAMLLACVVMMTMACMPLVNAEPVAESTADETTDSMQTVSKIYSLTMTETEGRISTTPATPAFWEYPLLRAGETLTTDGTMIVRNDSEFTVDMQLEPILLPYGDSAKLAYLDSLWLTVKEGETVIYDNTYAHVNDADGGLALNYAAMAPAEEHVYTISLKCPYNYEGDPYADATQLNWNFSAKTETTVYEESQGLPQWAQILVLAFAVMIVILIIIMIVQAIINHKKKRRVQDDMF